MQGREGPSGPYEPMLRCSKAAAAYSAGVALVIPYDTVDYEKGDGIILLPTPLGGQFQVGMGPGLYLVQAQVQLAGAAISRLGIAAATGTAIRQVANDQPVGTQWNQCTFQVLVPKTETPLQANPRIYAGIEVVLTVTGASGNAIASLLVQRLASIGN